MSQSELCRTCLVNLSRSKSKQHIFTTNVKDNLAEIIFNFTGVKVEKEDGYPQWMCLACVHLARSAAYFKKITLVSDSKLRNQAGHAECFKTDSEDLAQNDATVSETDRDENNFVDSDSDSDAEFENNDAANARGNGTDGETDPEDGTKLIEFLDAKRVKESDSTRMEEISQEQCVPADTPKQETKSESCWRKEARAMFLTVTREDPDGGPTEGPDGRPHGGPERVRYECRHCGQLLNKRNSMYVHAQKHIGYRFMCEVCGKGFPNNASLKTHFMIRHGLKKSYACSKCPFTSAVRFELRVHERTHTGERPFVCDTCGNSFYRRRCLIVHARSHEAVKPVKCTSCDKRFALRSDMQSHHNAAHERRYVYPCPECGRAYARRSTVYRHALSQHRVQLAPLQLSRRYV